MSKQRFLATITFCCLVPLFAGAAAAQQTSDSVSAAIAKESEVPGATNFTRLDSNFASGGVTTPEAFARLGQMGFRTVINLRTASEPSADIEGEALVVGKTGMTYLSLPFSTASPDGSTVDKFLETIKNAPSQPVYIHCRSGARANTFWLIKRVLADKWTVDQALAEADRLKLTDAPLRKFALAYIEDHNK